ncbi:MAG: hypothetical protein KC443_10760 [Anaerolineales bacterium]|nr:hypothetical protein [Anaerolineales bacterium]
MSENTPAAYAAMITISLPGTDKTATASVVLLPEDAVTTTSGVKQLRDCTLAELQTFANTWEAEVWETYQTIRLIDLDENEAVQVMVTRVAESGDAVLSDWADRAIVLTPTAVSTETAPAESTTVEAEATAEALEAEAEVEITAVSEPVTPEAPTATPVDEVPHVHVAASEPVYDEEAVVLEGGAQQPMLPPRPQVRIAGQQLPLSRSAWAATDIFIEEPALHAAQAHALSSLNREVAGVLVGPRPEKQPDGRYNVYITDTIIAKYTVMHGASVTYTPESWRYMNDQLWERYPDESAIIVGWYHTHPGFGIFLSGMDQFIHQNFFIQKWHVALVLDPIAKTSGFFSWDRQKTRVSRYDFPWPTWASMW